MLVPSSDVAVSTACDREDAPRRWSSSSWSKRRRPVQPPSDREICYAPQAAIGSGCWYHTWIHDKRNRAHNGSASRQSAAMTRNAVPPIRP